MSPKNFLLNTGLTALGWFGFAASSLVAADPGPPAPPGQPTAVAPSPSLTVLSLSDGKVYQGKIQVDDTGYSVLQNGGVLRFRKELVEGVFGSIQEVYRFKADRVPARDPDERMKLARWCLTHHLTAEAKAQLLAVLELSPRNEQTENMIVNIDNATTRATLRDEAIVRTRGELVADGRPAELDPSIVRSGRGMTAGVGLPMIFDLPTPLAVKRADEFSSSRIVPNVHQVLQRACAKCHNENYQGAFQLIQVKTKHDWTPNVARANLEAVLRLVDPESPSRSELLSRALVPHGPYKRPIFRGATDPDYQRVAAWVNSLRPRPAAAEQAAPTRFGSPEPVPSASGSGGFATGRANPGALPLPAAAPTDGRPQPPALANPVTPLPPGQFVRGSGSGIQPYAPPDADFPVPYMVGGPKPKLTATQAAATPTPAPAVAGALPPLPATAPAAAANVPSATDNAAPKPPSKPVKLDPALLERALMNRYAPQQ